MVKSLGPRGPRGRPPAPCRRRPAHRPAGGRPAAGHVRARRSTPCPTSGMVALLAVGSWRISTGAISTGELVQADGPVRHPHVPDAGRRASCWRRCPAPSWRPTASTTCWPRRPARAPTPDAGHAAARPGPLAVDVAGLRLRLRRRAGARRPRPGPGPGRGRGAGRRDRRGQVDAVPPARPPLRADGGTVRLGGVDLRSAPSRTRCGRTWRSAFQEAFLFGDTVRENLTLGEDVADDELRWALERARADRFVARLPDGLDQQLGERGVTLSGGQRQRLALARALLRRPGLLMLDDATSAVDPTIEQQILDGPAHVAARHHADRRPPGVDDHPGRPGAVPRGRAHRRRGLARRPAGRACPPTPPWPGPTRRRRRDAPTTAQRRRPQPRRRRGGPRVGNRRATRPPAELLAETAPPGRSTASPPPTATPDEERAARRRGDRGAAPRPGRHARAAPGHRARRSSWRW